MQKKIHPCPYCGSSSVTSSNGYTRCMVFGCISYHFSPATTAEWQSKKWRSGVEKMVWIMVHSGKLERHLTTLALDGGDSAAFQAVSTPEVLSTLQGESTPAHRK